MIRAGLLRKVATAGSLAEPAALQTAPKHAMTCSYVCAAQTSPAILRPFQVEVAIGGVAWTSSREVGGGSNGGAPCLAAARTVAAPS